MGRPVVSLKGRVFGRLTVQELESTTPGATWRCQCECGNISIVSSSNLKRGGTTSCGCLRDELSKARATIHGETGSRAFNVWRGMRERCSLSTHKSFHRYGGRGIRVCDRWEHFELFFADMGPPPSDKHSIERTDSNGNYEPGNCVWADWRTQARNRCNNVFYEFNGRQLVIKDVAEASGVPEQTLYKRLRRGFSIEEAIHGKRSSNR